MNASGEILNLPAMTEWVLRLYGKKTDYNAAQTKQFLPSFGVSNSNETNVVASLLPPIDFSDSQEANIVKSESENLKSSKIEAIFKELAKKWKEQAGTSPSIAGMLMNPAYMEIISYGDKMIPFILKDLQNKPSHWFIALRILARTSPVKPEDAGNIKKMTEAWLAWGRENGKLA